MSGVMQGMKVQLASILKLRLKKYLYECSVNFSDVQKINLRKKVI
uniref:Uncharacterized protein n=1 Tax=Anguilla anguilla TaxID=7936 RepID=A0A0E9RT00_ANGAN